MIQLRTEFLYAIRSLMRAPAMTVPAALCLALGIGLNALVFGLVGALVFRVPPLIRDPARVSRAYLTFSQAASGPAFSSEFSIPDFLTIRNGTGVFALSAAYLQSEAKVGAGLDAAPAHVAWVTVDFFRTLGVAPAMGRFFADAEASLTASSAQVVVLSDGYWRRRFDAKDEVVGSSLTLDGIPYTIIGVAPPRFRGAELTETDLWVPLGGAGRWLSPMLGRDWVANRTNRLVSIVGRLAPGTSRSRAAQQVNALLRAASPNPNRYPTPSDGIASLAPIAPGRGPGASQEATVGVWAVAVAFLVLCIACANVASLAIVRFDHRAPQFALRRALGATRLALSRMVLLESGALAAIGGIAALALVYSVAPIVGAIFGDPEMATGNFLLDWNTVWFALVLIAFSTLLTAIVPIREIWRRDLSSRVLSESSVRAGRSSRGVRILVVGQIGLTLVLLVSAGLLIRSLRNLRAIELGFNPDRLVVATTDLSSAGFAAGEGDARIREAVATIGATPGVFSAAAGITAPFGSSFGMHAGLPGSDSSQFNNGLAPRYNAVSPQYFVATGTQILAGRGFAESDQSSGERVAIVSQTLARLFWPNASPIGGCIVLGAPDAACRTIVGVAADTRSQELRGPVDAQVYVPLAQNEIGLTSRVLFVRLAADGGPVTERTIARALQANGIPMGMVIVRSMESFLDPQVRPWRLGVMAFTAFGALALVLAAVGLYGVLAYIVVRRTREIGVRIALGATPAAVVRMIVSEGARLALAGIAAGTIGALVAGRAMGALLYGVSSADVGVLAIGIVILLLSAILACLVPVVRATRLHPSAALRFDS
jgi:predicted permease